MSAQHCTGVLLTFDVQEQPDHPVIAICSDCGEIFVAPYVDDRHRESVGDRAG